MLLKFLITNIKIKEKITLNYTENLGNVNIFTNFPIITWNNQKKEKFVLIGNTYEKKISNLNLRKELENFYRSKNLEGSFIVIKCSEEKLEIWTDKFGKRDLFYVDDAKKNLIATSSLDILYRFQKDIFEELDQFGIAQSLIIYGARPSKKNTFYKKIKRLGYYQKFIFENDNFDILNLDFPIYAIESYEVGKMNNYYDIFMSTLENYSKSNNIVYLSSGWDSTSILAGLRQIRKKSEITCVICKLNYSNKYGIMNDFELKKAQKFAKFYDVNLEVVENNTASENFVYDYYPKVEDLLKPYNFNFFTGLNHYLLAEHVSKKLQIKDATVFAGEMSDGSHNLGFSQYLTLFHPKSYDFREYSDKMMSYLFGPTFLSQIYENKHLTDPIWKILNNESNKIEKIENLNNFEKNIVLLKSFFILSTRFPLASLKEDILTSEGSQLYNDYMCEKYLKDSAIKLNNENYYSIFLNLYNSFHWQGSTVGTLGLTAEYFGLNFCNPFNSIKMFDFLSKMPENWGRGLDLNSTKYPLKYILKNKLKYPMELQEGPHSYLYDVDTSINFLEEVIYNSGFSRYAKEKLTKKNLIDRLDHKFFDMDYINSILTNFKDGKILKGSKQKDLGSIIANSLVNTY
jgi:hypothetical protein